MNQEEHQPSSINNSNSSSGGAQVSKRLIKVVVSAAAVVVVIVVVVVEVVVAVVVVVVVVEVVVVAVVVVVVVVVVEVVVVAVVVVAVVVVCDVESCHGLGGRQHGEHDKPLLLGCHGRFELVQKLKLTGWKRGLHAGHVPVPVLNLVDRHFLQAGHAYRKEMFVNSAARAHVRPSLHVEECVLQIHGTTSKESAKTPGQDTLRRTIYSPWKET
ncbi:hypothetical protein ElyMa_001235200 [Elysia marginata]|uniref:Uncharacterized protein n=1 Tax=Elysia marginata TaxID=1093978 RepID=A0AAV4IAC8_9GAST|nr:hypothetical protein ElyMa_001235200 [Elysia marginata]